MSILPGEHILAQKVKFTSHEQQCFCLSQQHMHYIDEPKINLYTECT